MSVTTGTCDGCGCHRLIIATVGPSDEVYMLCQDCYDRFQEKTNNPDSSIIPIVVMALLAAAMISFIVYSIISRNGGQ